LRGRTIDQLVSETWVVPLAMVVRRELVKCLAQVPFAERNDAIQAFLRHRPDESLRVRVAVRRCRRRARDARS
jgi:hypothetical protein